MIDNQVLLDEALAAPIDIAARHGKKPPRRSHRPSDASFLHLSMPSVHSLANDGASLYSRQQNPSIGSFTSSLLPRPTPASRGSTNADDYFGEHQQVYGGDEPRRMYCLTPQRSMLSDAQDDDEPRGRPDTDDNTQETSLDSQYVLEESLFGDMFDVEGSGTDTHALKSVANRPNSTILPSISSFPAFVHAGKGLKRVIKRHFTLGGSNMGRSQSAESHRTNTDDTMRRNAGLPLRGQQRAGRGRSLGTARSDDGCDGESDDEDGSPGQELMMPQWERGGY